MQKYLLIILLLLPTGLGAQAQPAAAPVAAPAGSVAPSLKADSAAALHRLFAKRRTGGVIYTVAGTVFAIRVVASSASRTTVSTGGGPITIDNSPSGGAIATGVGIGLLLDGIGVGKLARFTKAKEAVIVKDYDQGKPLPKAIRRRLKAKHF
ncbi:hypothetical protein GCM10022406_37240 [Hymenobacter algoricola]|uniref:Uncharacterized protein n=2 Tax=Hymenobacter algoricola TaxID=486267 RepID=A0ABP7NQF3_9BACT